MCFGNDRPKTLLSKFLALSHGMLQFDFTGKKSNIDHTVCLACPFHWNALPLFPSSCLGLRTRTRPVGFDLNLFPTWEPHLQGKVVGCPHGVAEVGSLRAD